MEVSIELSLQCRDFETLCKLSVFRTLFLRFLSNMTSCAFFLLSYYFHEDEKERKRLVRERLLANVSELVLWMFHTNKCYYKWIKSISCHHSFINAK